jgi:hypothetical protein
MNFRFVEIKLRYVGIATLASIRASDLHILFIVADTCGCLTKFSYRNHDEQEDEPDKID